jgi:formate-dependent nitrite reductase membrane component NrfD
LSYIEPLLIALGLLTAVYTAFLFAQAKGRDFWQSPMLGLHMIIHSVMAGGAVFLIASQFAGTRASLLDTLLTAAAVAAIAFNLLIVAIELTTTHSTSDAHAVAKMITSGEFSDKFWFGMVLVGNILPLMALLLGPPAVMAPAGVLILLGLWLAEDIWVKAPQRIPLS